MILLMIILLAVVFAMWLLEGSVGKALQNKLNSGARVSGPLFSLSASGTVGKAFTFGTWKGIPYVREWFRPSNPNSALQQNVRKAMSLAVQLWQDMHISVKESYDAGASGKGYSGFNLMMKRAMNSYVTDLGTDVDPLSVTEDGLYPSDVFTWLPVV